MDENEDVKVYEYEQPAPESAKPKKSVGKTIIFILLVLILLGASAGASYWWRDKTATEFENKQANTISSLQETKTSLEKQLAVEKAKNTGTTTIDQTGECDPVSPSTSVIENIKASINSRNTAALEGYMAESVNVILAATEAYGPQTPTQAVSDITTFISDETLDWDFLLPASVLSSYGQGGYGEYFSNIDTVGKSVNGKVISFSFDCDAKISTVFMASNENLLE